MFEYVLNYNHNWNVVVNYHLYYLVFILRNEWKLYLLLEIVTKSCIENVWWYLVVLLSLYIFADQFCSCSCFGDLIQLFWFNSALFLFNLWFNFVYGYRVKKYFTFISTFTDMLEGLWSWSKFRISNLQLILIISILFHKYVTFMNKYLVRDKNE